MLWTQYLRNGDAVEYGGRVRRVVGLNHGLGVGFVVLDSLGDGFTGVESRHATRLTPTDATRTAITGRAIWHNLPLEWTA